MKRIVSGNLYADDSNVDIVEMSGDELERIKRGVLVIRGKWERILKMGDADLHDMIKKTPSPLTLDECRNDTRIRLLALISLEDRIASALSCSAFRNLSIIEYSVLIDAVMGYFRDLTYTCEQTDATIAKILAERNAGIKTAKEYREKADISFKILHDILGVISHDDIKYSYGNGFENN